MSPAKRGAGPAGGGGSRRAAGAGSQASPADREARVRAATVFDRNLVVTAGAGTGKTSLLVERFLNLLLGLGVPLARVVAITFTEKAAGEMRQRLAQALDDVLLAVAPAEAGAAREPDPESEAGRSLRWLRAAEEFSADRMRERAQAALDELDGASVRTIHGFCSDLLRRHARAAGLPPEVSVDEGLGQELLFDTLWPEFLAAELGPRAEREDLWTRVLAAFTEGEIEDAARAVALNPLAADLLAREGYRPLDVLANFGPRAERLLAELAAGREEVTAKRTGNMQAFLDTALVLLRAFLDGGVSALAAADPAAFALPEFWDRKTAYSAGPEKQLGERKAEIEGAAAEALKLLKTLRTLDEASFPDLLEVLRPFAERFRARVLRDGVLAYEDLLILTRNLLRTDPGVRTRESERARAVLLDEFQDTDPLQYEIVFLLAAADPGAEIADPWRVEPAPGRLFIVGDPKQSIYRFRGADMAAYQRASARVLGGGEPESLTVNFRSVPGILEPVNRLFESWMGPASETEPAYEPITAHRRGAGNEPGVELWSVRCEAGAGAEERREGEARAIAAGILEMCRPASGTRSWALRDVAVLFRSLNDVVLYARVLREAGIDYVVDGGKAFRERPEVVEALALLSSLANPADPVAVLAVLRSTLGGVPDEELAAHARAGGGLYWPGRGREEAGDPRFPRIGAALARLDRLHEATKRLPVDRRIMTLLTEGDFAVLQAAYHDGAQRTANVRKLAERTAGLAREEGLTLEGAIQAIRDEFTGNRTEGESPLADEAVDAVRLLSMHKAKGLEYPVVFVPDLNRGPAHGFPETRAGVFRDPTGTPRLCLDLTGRSRRRNAAAVLAAEEDALHEEAERKRVLYVAMTRARSRLILVNAGVSRLSPWMKALGEHWGYAVDGKAEDPFGDAGPTLCHGLVRHRRVDGDIALPAAPAEAAVDAVAAVRAFEIAASEARERARAVRARTPSADHRAQRTDAAGEDESNAPAARSRDLARAAGRTVHAALERADFGDRAGLADRLAEATAVAAPGAAAEFKLEAEAVRRAALEILGGFLDSELPARLAGAAILGRETPILFRDAEGAVVHGYADLVYELDGRVIVADYKTDAGEPAALAESYRSQLADYAAAAQGALGLAEPPATELLLVRTGLRVPVSGEDA